MDSFTSLKAEELKAKIPIIKQCFEDLFNSSCHAKSIKDDEKKQFNDLYQDIDEILSHYQRGKVGALCRNFEELSTVFSTMYKSSLLENQKKFQIKLQILPIFSIIGQPIELS